MVNLFREKWHQVLAQERAACLRFVSWQQCICCLVFYKLVLFGSSGCTKNRHARV